MAKGLRKTGIEIVGDIPWGTHFCHFYETEEDLLDILIPYFKTGLESHEFCMWIVSEAGDEAKARSALESAIPEVDRHLSKGDIEILPYEKWYLKDGAPDLEHAINRCKEKAAQAIAKGYEGIRVNGSGAWLSDREWKDFSKYEKELNDLIADQKIIVLCSYPLAATNAAELFDIAAFHEFAIARRRGKWAVLETPDLKKAKAEINKLYEDQKNYTAMLKQSNKELENFIHVASHDLQEPLRKIQTFADRVLQKTMEILDQKAREDLERIRQAAGRMQALVLDLVEYSRVASKPPVFTKFNLRDPVDEAISDLAILFEEKGGSIEISELPEIEADRVQIRQLFQNLIGNSLKYRGEKDPLIRIFSTPSVEQFWEISVEDNGIGFNEKYIKKMFQPFQRLHSKKSPYGGAGIGLAICRKIVERHGGSITARGGLGKGATFIVQLPKSGRKRG